MRCCDSGVGSEGIPRRNVPGLPEFDRSSGVSSSFVLGELVQRLARVSTPMKKLLFFFCTRLCGGEWEVSDC